MTRDEWLAQIEATPGDWQMALIAADEIEEAGDELFAEQLRFAVQWKMTFTVMSSVSHQETVAMFTCTTGMGGRTDPHRVIERRWCEQNSVRFIHAFPRSLDDVYAGRELV